MPAFRKEWVATTLTRRRSDTVLTEDRSRVRGRASRPPVQALVQIPAWVTAYPVDRATQQVLTSALLAATVDHITGKGAAARSSSSGTSSEWMFARHVLASTPESLRELTIAARHNISLQ